MATQFKPRADISFNFDSHTLFDDGSYGNPNANLDYPLSSTSYDQIVYSFLNSHGSLESIEKDANIQAIDDLEHNTEDKPTESNSNSSASPSNEQIIDSPDSYNAVSNSGNGETHPEIVSDELENSKSVDSIEVSDVVNSDQALITIDPVNAAIDENDFYITTENVSMCLHDFMAFDSFTIANDDYVSNLDTSMVIDVEQIHTFVNAEDTPKSTVVDYSVTDDFNFSGEVSVGCPGYELIVIDESYAEEPFIIDDASDLEEFITDETTPGSYDQIAPPLADEEFYSDDLVETDFEITEETSEELIEDYEVPNDVLVDDGSYIPTESIDDNTDPLAEVTDEPFTIYSYFYCGTMDVTFSLEEYIDESYQADGLDFSVAVCDISFDELTFDDTPIDNLNEVAADSLTIIPLGLPISNDVWICSGCDY